MKHSQGFTIIELVIVVGLLAIISMMAAGYLSGSSTRAHRTEARSALTEASGLLEKCKSLNGTYIGCNVTFPTSILYAFTVVRAAITFTLTATPVGAQLTSDDDCKTLTLTNTGLKGATGANTDVCW